jgi:S-adenosylmethionine decarboxylase|tara:strand:+ start:670 stop:1062 length:393 start_codon:yes stop_codon:yes gene_type:complete
MYGRRKLGRVKQSQVPSQTSVGIHYIVDIDDMDTDIINDKKNLIEICEKALELGEVTILHKMIHHFEPQGLTLLYLLTESHFSLHTWPEHSKIRIDFFSCEKNESKCNMVIDHLKTGFNCMGMKISMLRR